MGSSCCVSCLGQRESYPSVLERIVFPSAWYQFINTVWYQFINNESFCCPISENPGLLNYRTSCSKKQTLSVLHFKTSICFCCPRIAIASSYGTETGLLLSFLSVWIHFIFNFFCFSDACSTCYLFMVINITVLVFAIGFDLPVDCGF